VISDVDKYLKPQASVAKSEAAPYMSSHVAWYQPQVINNISLLKKLRVHQERERVLKGDLERLRDGRLQLEEEVAALRVELEEAREDILPCNTCMYI
jgi:hypothetical protein